MNAEEIITLIGLLREQAIKDRNSSVAAKGFESAARWDAWATAYAHLLVTINEECRRSAARGKERAE